MDSYSTHKIELFILILWMILRFGVADGARTHDNRNHNPKLIETIIAFLSILAMTTFKSQRYLHLKQYRDKPSPGAGGVKLTTSN
jgi:hypothetical protein